MRIARRATHNANPNTTTASSGLMSIAKNQSMDEL